jgi:hypothetical protein
MAFFFVDFPDRICIQHFLYVIRNCKHNGGVKLSGSGNLHIKIFQEIRYCFVFSELLVTWVVLKHDSIWTNLQLEEELKDTFCK